MTMETGQAGSGSSQVQVIAALFVYNRGCLRLSDRYLRDAQGTASLSTSKQ